MEDGVGLLPVWSAGMTLALPVTWKGMLMQYLDQGTWA